MNVLYFAALEIVSFSFENSWKNLKVCYIIDKVKCNLVSINHLKIHINILNPEIIILRMVFPIQT